MFLANMCVFTLSEVSATSVGGLWVCLQVEDFTTNTHKTLTHQEVKGDKDPQAQY